MPVTDFLSTLTSLVLKGGFVGLVLNEIRGFILAAPVLFGMYRAGGNLMAMWLGFCALSGIAASVVLPVIIARKLQPTAQ